MKVAMVTGGAQGIGKAVARRLLEEGWAVTIAESDRQALNETKAEWRAFDQMLFVPTDVSREADVKRCVRLAARRFGRLDALVNNAGVSRFAPFATLTLKEWNRVVGINLTGMFLCAHAAAPHLKKTNGVIINMASTRALMSEPGTEAYAASKGGIVALTHALAVSLGPQIRVHCISPGWIETSAWKKKVKRAGPDLRPADHAQHPVGRVGQPEDIAGLTAFLLSADAGFMTGENIVIDGGMTRKMIYV